MRHDRLFTKLQEAYENIRREEVDPISDRNADERYGSIGTEMTKGLKLTSDEVLTLEACLDLTLYDENDSIEDCHSRLEAINRNLRHILHH